MEFILDIENEPFVKNGKKLYKSAAFESLVFDQKGLDKLERYDRAKREAEKKELKKLREQVDSLCGEVQRLTCLEYKSYGIAFQEGNDAGLKKLHDALRTISLMSYDERTTLFGVSSITGILAKHDPFEIIDRVAKFKSDKEKKNSEYKLFCEVEGNLSGTKGVVCSISGNDLSVLYHDPTFSTKFVKTIWKKDVCKPTGKVYTNLLEFISDEDEESN